MRHQVFGKKFNRDIKERKALFKSLLTGLIDTGKIKTTLPKGKAIVRLADKLVSQVKSGSLSQLSQVTAFLAKKDLVDKLVKDIAPRFGGVTGGYVRMVRLGKRAGDGSEEVSLSWSREALKKEKEETPRKAAKKEVKKETKKSSKKETVTKKETKR
ncbi:50S ribosomal protein L17 [Patescibacteria group bacterium]|nr:50S ribosomal protein L17 [Patescibacteria group bacterium]MCL5797270.1 50S ribosomal protein L17 [Patescibacteria group bacterium]